jgi:hypothetical protein
MSISKKDIRYTTFAPLPPEKSVLSALNPYLEKKGSLGENSTGFFSFP